MKKIIGVFDTKLNGYECISVFDNDNVAIRYFVSVADKIPFFDDKKFVVVGTFNEESGEVISLSEKYELNLGGDIVE